MAALSIGRLSGVPVPRVPGALLKMARVTADIELPERYLHARHLASGGMAAVFAAEDVTLGRAVAVKVLSERFLTDRAAVRRFEREARAAAKASQHPHVVTIYDVGEHDDRPFIVMELMGGGSLATALRNGRPPREDALRWIGEAAAALDHAHEHGIIHRDVKPGNLLLDDRGRLGVADFGIARLAYESAVTQTGEVLGTASYVSPEQVRGEGVSAASDRYSLAVVAYELLSGAKPYGGGTFPAQARQHMEAEPRPIAEHAPDLPPAVDRVLRRGLAKAPDARWPSATAFAEALTAAESGPATASEPTATVPLTRSAPPIPRSAPPPDPHRRRALLAPAALMGAVLLAVILAIALSGGDDGSRPEAKRTPTRETAPKRERTNTGSTPASGTPAATPPATPADSESVSSLNARGFAFMNEGRYGEAIPLLQRAVERCGDSRETVCAYALYNLGRSLRLAGRPAEAIPVLERRLTYGNQTETVQAELDAARSAAGQTAPSGGEDGKPGKGNGKDKGGKKD
jgi:eukaryotic-like serine/threonine-protein kinase